MVKTSVAFGGKNRGQTIEATRLSREARKADCWSVRDEKFKFLEFLKRIVQVGQFDRFAEISGVLPSSQ